MAEEKNIIHETPLAERIKKDTFFKIVSDLKNLYDRDSAVWEASGKTIELINYADDYMTVIDMLSEVVFTSNEWDTITWYLYEQVEKDIWMGDKSKQKLIAKLNNIEDLWEYLQNGYNKAVISETEYNTLVAEWEKSQESN